MDAKPDVWMPLYIGDYLRDTMHLTAIEHGAYLLLLMHYWTNGPPRDVDVTLHVIARCTAEEWQSIRDTVSSFFRIEGGFWHHKRADEERRKAIEVKEIQRNRTASATAARIAKSRNVTSNVTSNVTLSPSPSPSPSPLIQPITPPPPTVASRPRVHKNGSVLPAGFVRFWSTWPSHRRKTNRVGCAKFWERHACELITDQICAAVEAEKKSEQWKKDGGEFIPLPATWLHQQRWETPPSPEVKWSPPKISQEALDARPI